jgi:hypothetical protein
MSFEARRKAEEELDKRNHRVKPVGGRGKREIFEESQDFLQSDYFKEDMYKPNNHLDYLEQNGDLDEERFNNIDLARG